MRAIETVAVRFQIMRGLLAFFWDRKWWWITPMLLVLLLFGVLIAFSQGSAIAPFIYALF